MKKIGFPHPPGSGGPGSFQSRFERELIKRGFKVTYPYSEELPDIIFVVGGTRRIKWLINCKIKKIPIIYRLDGINWLHRKRKAKRDIRTILTSEITNILCKIIHAFIADYIIYQSLFVNKWWDKKGWIKAKNYEIIHNGIDLLEFIPLEGHSSHPPSLICLEGFLDYSPYAIELINELNDTVEIDFKVYGGIKSQREQNKLRKEIEYLGEVSSTSLPEVYRNSIYFSLDVNAACPNTVVEALACGAPVVGFDTGALKELVTDDSGIIVAYGSNPWKLNYPDVKGLADAIRQVTKKYEYYSTNARKVAINNFDIRKMMDRYLNVINKLL